MSILPTPTPTASHPREEATRADVLAHAERLRRAALRLASHASRVRDERSPAHASVLHEVRGMVRRLTSEEERWRHE